MLSTEEVYALLKRRIDSRGVSQDKVDKAIESYFERNPVNRTVYFSETRSVGDTVRKNIYYPETRLVK